MKNLAYISTLLSPAARRGLSLTDSVRSILENRWFVPGLAVIGTVLRLALIFYMGSKGSLLFYDEGNYDHIGLSLSLGHGFVQFGDHYSAYRAPAQPMLLALIFHFLGHHLLYAKVCEAILLAIIPFVCARIGRDLGLSVAASNLGAALATFHPGLNYASATIYPSVLTACGITVGLWLCNRLAVKFALRDSIIAGLSLALAGSATTTFAPLALLAALVMAFKKSYRAALVVGFVGTLPILIWMLRNEAVMGRFTLATNGGYNLFLGGNDKSTPMSGNWVEPHLPNEYDRGEIVVDDDYRLQAVRWIKAHPTRWAKLALERSVLVLDSVGNAKTQGLHSGILGHLAGWLMLPIILIGVAGVCYSYKSPLAWFTIAALSLVVASSASTIVKPRFRFPCDPLLCEFSVVALVRLRLTSRNSLKPVAFDALDPVASAFATNASHSITMQTRA